VVTKLFPHGPTLPSDYATCNNDANLRGTAVIWEPSSLGTTTGGDTVTDSVATVAGATAGVEVTGTTRPYVWYSAPLDADVTISGSITWNIWAAESSASANVAINGRIEKIDGATGVITLIDATARTTEVAVTTRAVNNFSETPAAGVACKRGDRLRVRIYGDDSTTMASGFTFNARIGGATPGSDGDTWVQLTETLSFAAEPAGTTIYPTDDASVVSTASVDREAWTSRGAGVQTDVTNTVTGWTAPIQVTDTAGGTVVDWFTRPLAAFTLGGAVRVNARTSETGSPGVSIRCEIAVTAGDGSGAVVWAYGGNGKEPSSTEAAQSFLIAGDDVAVSSGQRLRVRFYIDDAKSFAMIAAKTGTLFYAGTTPAASGDTWLTFTQTLTEVLPTPPLPRRSIYPQVLPH